MANLSQFEGFKQRPSACAACEVMLPEAVDGTLSEVDQRVFDTHVAGCAECARELAEAKRGAAWLSILKSHAPEPPSGLLAKILAQTSEAVQLDSSAVAAPIDSRPAWETAPHPAAIKSRRDLSQWAAFRKQLGDMFSIGNTRVFQPNIAMTAAMAFFSIALTLNLTGVHLRDLRASNFTPSAVKRSIANVDASAMRIFQNNRAIYQMESRLSELRSDAAPGDDAPDGHR